MIEFFRVVNPRHPAKFLSQYLPKYQLNFLNRGSINFIDVGSAGNLPAPWKSNAYLIKFLLNFDPSESPQRTRNTCTLDTAVWQTDEERILYIYKGFKGTGSSLFQQNFKYVKSNWDILKTRGPRYLANTWFDRSELIETRKVRCLSLDGIIGDEFPDIPFHFLKIDAQGAEYNILKGASSLLISTCVGLHLELFTIPLYKGIRLMDEVVTYLEEFGFQLVLKFPAHGTFESQHDCLFLHEDREPSIHALICKTYDIRNSA